MSSSANQPVCVGTSRSVDLRPEPHEAEAGRAEQVLDRPAGDDVGTERADVELDRAARLVAVGEHERAVRRARPRRSRRRRAGAPSGRRRSCSRRAPSARRSPRRSARAGSGRRRPGRTWTTSAPRSSCACAICPTVGNSYSLITIRFRSPSRGSAETSALTPCETEVVTATSSASAWSSRATPRGTPRSARPRSPTRRRSRPSRRATPRRPRGRGARAPPASTS